MGFQEVLVHLFFYLVFATVLQEFHGVPGHQNKSAEHFHKGGVPQKNNKTPPEGSSDPNKFVDSSAIALADVYPLKALKHIHAALTNGIHIIISI